jgi:putative ABC transport system substrate-binding protein
MRRREFIKVVAGTVAALPIAARGQQAAMPVIGFLYSGSNNPAMSLSLAAFRRGLKEGGFAEGQNVAIEYRWAEGRYDQLPALAADLAQHQVAVIAATGGGSGLAAKSITKTIPIVFTTGADPIKEGLVTSINRPTENTTGVNLLLNAMEGKKLGLLREMIPTASLIAVLLNPANPSFETQLSDAQDAASRVGQKIHIFRANGIHIFRANGKGEIDAALGAAHELGAGALLAGADAVFASERDQLITLTTQYAMPAIFHMREFAKAGGLMSYSTDVPDAYRQLGNYAARILKGEKPSDLPVISSVKFEFLINLKTAKALHVEVPPGLSARADEVIE